MDYNRIYSEFIDDRRKNPTGDIRAELHHVIPLSAGGTNEVGNIIRLSVRDHLFAHKVLRRLGLSPVATNKMSRDVARKILSSYSPEVGFRGRTPFNSRKRINTIVCQSGPRLKRMSDEFADMFLKLFAGDSMLSKCRLGFNKTTKYHKFFIKEVYPKMKDFVTVEKLDVPTAADAHPGEYYVFTGSSGKEALRVKEGDNGAMDELLTQVRANLENMTHLPTEIRYSMGIVYSEREYDTFVRMGFSGAFRVTTGMKPGTYRLLDLVKETDSLVKRLFRQNLLVEHIDDGGYERLDLGPDCENPGENLLLMQLAVLTGEEYKKSYEGIMNRILEDAVKVAAGSKNAQEGLYWRAHPIAMQCAGRLKEHLAERASEAFLANRMINVSREVLRFMTVACLKAIRQVFYSQPDFSPVN